MNSGWGKKPRLAAAVSIACVAGLVTALPAEAESRRSISKTVYTNGSAAAKGAVSVTWIDVDEVNDIDLSATDLKCDNRAADISVHVKIRSNFGDVGWVRTYGGDNSLTTGGCGSTQTSRDMYVGTTAWTDASAVYSARLTICMSSCYYAYSDNPYSNDPDSSTG